MSGNQRVELNSFSKIGAAKAPPAKVGNIYQIKYAAGIAEALAGSSAAEQLEEGDYVLALAKRNRGQENETTVYAVLDLSKGPGKTEDLKIRPYFTFESKVVPGSLKFELSTRAFVDLTLPHGSYTINDEPWDDDGDRPGAVLRVENARELNEHVTGSMKNYLQDGDVLLNLKDDEGPAEYVVLELNTLGWRVQPDTRFLLNEGFVGNVLTVVSPEEFVALNEGLFTHHRDYSRGMGFGQQDPALTSARHLEA